MRSLKWLLALYVIEGLLAVAWTFFTPSESGSAVVLWLSRERLLLFGLTLFAWLVILGTAIWFWRSPAHTKSVQAGIDRYCLEDKRLAPVLIYLLVLPLLLLAASLRVVLTPLQYSAYRSWAPDTFPLLHSVVGAALPLILLASLMALELAAYLAMHYLQALVDRAFWSWRQTGPFLILLLAGTLTVFYWLVLVFRLRFFVNNPTWYWKFDPVAFNWGDLAFALVALLLLALVYWSLILRRRILPGLLVLFVLGYFLQLSVGLMAGGGFASFRDRYFSSYHKTYISKATQGSVTFIAGIRDYEALFGTRQFTNTKPPGLMTFYMGLDRLVNGHPSAYSDEMRFERLSALVATSFPVLAMFMVFALYAFARRYVPGRLGLVPALAPFLLILCPNLMLFSLFADQAVYPMVFLLGATFIIFVIQRQSVTWAFALGLFLYMAVFFAFTMLPLYPFVAIYLALSYWMNRRNNSLRRNIWMALAIGAGILLLYFLFRIFLNYDFFPRFAQAVSINHNFDFYLRVGRTPPGAPESFLVRLQQILGAAWLNHLDLAAAMGFPLYLLFLAGAVRLLGRLFKGAEAVRPGDIILAALLLSFLVLNVAGTAQGEVPRLWLFWLPMMVMLAALELEPYVADHPRLLLGLGVVQLITLFLTFHFQDLRM
jgi:hypothetical protein